MTRAHDALMGALDVLREVGDRNYEAYTLAYLGRLADRVGDAARAQELLERALHLSETTGSWESRFEARVGIAWLCLHRDDYAGALDAARQSQEIATHAGDRAREADACLVLGRAHEQQQQSAEALAAYRKAEALFEMAGRTHMLSEPRAGLARLALARSDAAEALARIDAILRLLDDRPLAGPQEPLAIYMTCYEVLHALGDPRAAGVLQVAQTRLREYADRVTDETVRC